MSWTALNIPETSFGSSGGGVQAASAATDARPGAIGLVLAGHHPLTLHGLSHVFAGESDCAVLAVCTDPEAIHETLRRHRPDIAILDLDRDDTFGVLRRIRREHLSVRVIILVASSEHDEMMEAMRLGAGAVVLKELPPDAVVTCIRKVHRGEYSIEVGNDDRLVARLFKSGTSMRNVIRQLTPREAEIARLAVQGVSTSEIAARLEVKQGTVKIHLHSIYTKLKVNGRLGLILFARRHGLA
jgi:DNA-binding NarL/FixJ family response regulator